MASPAPSDGRHTRRILVVEDDRALATVLKIKLTLEGFEVECAGDGTHAANVVRSFAPDLIVLDVTLPGTNGFELCRMWRDSLRIPIIMLTARSDKADKLRGLTMGADDYVTKPFDTQELVGAHGQAAELVRFVAARGQHDDRDSQTVTPHATQLESVGAGQRDIEHDQVRRERSHHVRRVSPVARTLDLEALQRQLDLEDRGQRAVILPHENAAGVAAV